MTKRLWIDPGSSGTKVLDYDEFCCYHFVESGVQQVSPLTEEERDEESLINYGFGSGLLEIGDDTYRIGGRPVVCCSANMKGPDLALKLIAILGAKDQGRGDSYHVGVLLPFNEFLHKESLIRTLEALLPQSKDLPPKAKFNGQPIRAKLKTLKVHPEGSGLIQNPSGIQVALMVGHTDISKIYFDNGAIDEERCRTYSYVGMGAIAQTLQIQGNDVAIAELLTRGKIRDLASRNALEPDYLEEQIEKRVKQFVASQIRPYFDAYNWEGIRSVLVGGGGAKFLLPYLSGCIPKGIKVSRLSRPEGIRLFGTSDARFFDIYGMAHRDKSMKAVIQSLLEGDVVEVVEVEVA